MNQPPVWVWDRILLAHMTLVLLQAENPESFGLNLPGSPSHAAEAVYAMPKPRICIATVQCYNPSSVPGEAPAVKVTVKKEQRRPLCCPHSYHGFVRKFGMCTINPLS